jgi:hypothetical protein
VPLVFRGGIKQNLWIKEDILPWLEKGQVPADPLTNLRTRDNGMSVYLVDEDDGFGVERYIAALAAGRGSHDYYDYLLFDHECLLRAGIRPVPTEGETPDEQVNAHHLDLVQLSGSQALALVTEILHTDFVATRSYQFEVAEYIRAAVSEGHIPKDRVSSGVARKVFPTTA